ncbi:hypothetical protein RHSIM_Rhsim13G0227900 [Rhododendron simsii]|uniref:Uncharacterized protein n=1 Tax=Rhododendron simsii TaxID=118357 RepID=A0A834FYN4_RHOSS|nr:hypothetical protein RHSIM_Rhsim13G0227900 [Rhododendron simsii]
MRSHGRSIPDHQDVNLYGFLMDSAKDEILVNDDNDYKSSFLEQSVLSGCSRRLELHRCLITPQEILRFHSREELKKGTKKHGYCGLQPKSRISRMNQILCFSTWYLLKKCILRLMGDKIIPSSSEFEVGDNLGRKPFYAEEAKAESSAAMPKEKHQMGTI